MLDIRGAVAAGLSILMLTTVCRRPAPVAHPTSPSEAPNAISASGKPPVGREIPKRVDLGLSIVDPKRWLIVDKVKADAPGAWATGDFDPKRNKLTIRTRDVAQFTIDTSRIPIRWERLVVIRIDGRNSELARRSSDVLHFVNDKRGWRVTDP